MKIVVNDQVHLSEFLPSDKEALVRHLNDPDIYARTLAIPFPYTDSDADDWLAHVAKATKQQGRAVVWAVRNSDAALIGGCGFPDLQVGQSRRAEVAYWLAKPYWGRGIMTAVVRRLCWLAFEEFELVKVTAHIFSDNPASARVLEKCGFREEGYLRKHYLKDGRFIDAKPFALLKEVG
jgi:RimJ/RimL family protein N-acetyltransferase